MKGLKALIRIAFSLFAFLLFAEPVRCDQGRPWLVKVSSVYADENDRGIAYHGAGTVVKAFGKYFVWTAAHLSQGNGVEIMNGTHRFKVKGRISMNCRDSELIEVEPTDVADFLAEYDSQDRMFEIPSQRSSDWEMTGVHTPPSKYGPIQPYVPGKVKQVGYKEVLVIPDWVSEKPEEARQRELFKGRFYDYSDINNRPMLSWTVDGMERVTSVKIEPGTSGAPVISWFYPKNSPKAFAYAIGGVTSRTDRWFEPSHFSPPDVGAALIEDYENGRRGVRDGCRWLLRHGLIVRAMSDGTMEVNPATTTVGAGGSVDGGGDSSSKSASVGRDPLSGKHVAVADVWRRYGIEPGILDRGAHAIIAYKATADKLDRPLILNASLSSRMMLEKSGSPYSVSPVPLNSELGPFLTQKVGTKLQNFRIRAKEGSVLEYHDGAVTLELQVPGSRDSIRLNLDRFGVAEGETKFSPYLYVRGEKSGKPFIIDLTDFYFTEPSHWRDLESLTSVQSNPKLREQVRERMLLQKAATPIIRVRERDDARAELERDHLIFFDGDPENRSISVSRKESPCSGTDGPLVKLPIDSGLLEKIK